ncbi:MAG TPA: hypothetical protein DIW23_12265 [Anaerolineae bacterium]|nr:hypothetical protein [Anaerolineae bacterium]
MSQAKSHFFICSICSQIRDKESATEYVHQPENNTSFPEAVGKLKIARDIDTNFELRQCPECKTYYLYRSIYEFLVGFGGSYDEYILWRITDEMGKDYVEGRLSEPPAGMI